MHLFERNTAPRREAGAPVAEPGGYDFVDVRTADGGVQRMTRSQFEGQALANRIRILVEGTAVFFRGQAVVSPSEALKGNR
jgi:hypothetical protein